MAMRVVCLRRRRAEARQLDVQEKVSSPIREVQTSGSGPTSDREASQVDDAPLFRRLDARDALALAAIPLGDVRRVVAVILEDGSVRAANGPSSNGRWSSGSVSGSDWILWWDRRAFPDASA